jgi:hypothetical protein
MNCANHPDTPAVAYCRTCGKPLCPACERPAQGTIFCEEHVVPAAAANPASTTTPPPPGAAAQPRYSPYTTPYASPYAGPAGHSASPGLAFVLGLIPGVGAIYNGQYAKGIIHGVVFGLIISLMHSGAAAGVEPVFAMLAMLWYFYMPFEAYHTARKRALGEPVDEFSSLFAIRNNTGFPAGPIVLILLGVLFLLNSLEVIRFYQLLRWWPLFLIALGVYLLVVRIAAARTVVSPGPDAAPREAFDGR